MGAFGWMCALHGLPPTVFDHDDRAYTDRADTSWDVPLRREETRRFRGDSRLCLAETRVLGSIYNVLRVQWRQLRDFLDVLL